jgi:hypothetical protein
MVAGPKHLESSIVVVIVIVVVVISVVVVIFCNLLCQNKLGLVWLSNPIRLNLA